MKVLTHKRDAEKYIQSVKDWDIKELEKKEVVKFLREYYSGHITNKRGHNPEALIEKIALGLRFILVHLKGYAQKDIKEFYDNLSLGKIKSFNKKTKKYNGSPYSQRSVVEIVSVLKRYLTFRFNKPELLKSLNVVISIKEKDVDSLSLSEINKLYKSCSTNKERYAVGVLFSSGMRAEEFLNVTLSDFTIPKDDGFIKLRVRHENTKTKGRTISLYYDKCFEAVYDYFNERKPEMVSPEEFVFNDSYVHLKNMIKRLGKKALGKRVYCHLLRHSSATWLSSQLNRQQLCIWFGWSFSSNMPDRYIDREGVEMKVIDEQQKQNNYQELQTKINKIDFENKKLKETLGQMKQRERQTAEGIVKLGNAILEIREKQTGKKQGRIELIEIPKK